ncbi:ATP-binding cassette domain-containing protein [Streptomyces vilmorinianum]|uniref:ATP-binding cassette domain-containing protein n=1 Tax=Streptomyces vilmorinianum TaxID=3051092 RepID=UPI0010FB6C94|nr:ABC transporter ATP-binding protein [Streptomyces vilmorinianum]
MIRFENVSVSYGEAGEPTLRDVNLTVPEGELVLLVGPSGVGKSTLLGAVSGLVPHFTGGTLTGRVTVAGRDTRTHKPRELADVVGTVGQDPLAHFVTDTVEDELAYGMESLGLAPEVMRRRVEETLDLLGLAELRDRPIATLSGGQQQRVAIGSVLTPHPKVLVLDEPTSALDPAAAEDVLAVLQRLVHDLGTTVLMAEHRLERVVQYADQVILLPDGAMGPPAEIMSVSPVHPPVVALGRVAGWSPLPMTVRDARRRSGDLRVRLEARLREGGPAGLLPHPAPSRNRGLRPQTPAPQSPAGLNVREATAQRGPREPATPDSQPQRDVAPGAPAEPDTQPARREATAQPGPESPTGPDADPARREATAQPGPETPTDPDAHPARREATAQPGPETPTDPDAHPARREATAQPGREALARPNAQPPRREAAAQRGPGAAAPGHQPSTSPRQPAAEPPMDAAGKGRGGGISRFWRRPRPDGPAPTDALVDVRALGVRRGRVEALRRVDLTVRAGETVALMGRNGAGKSTLLSALVGMVEPTSGSVLVRGRVPHRTDPRELIRHVGLVPQEPRDLLYADTVTAECAAADADASAVPGTCRALVSELLPGVADDTHPRDLSEGQRLALALAVVLTGRPPLLLLDEPTRGLDYAAKARLVAHLRELAAAGHAIVLATHDVELAAELAHRVVILAGGEVVADGPTAEVVVSSPAFSPQVAKILAPQPWLTVEQVAAALREAP